MPLPLFLQPRVPQRPAALLQTCNGDRDAFWLRQMSTSSEPNVTGLLTGVTVHAAAAAATATNDLTYNEDRTAAQRSIDSGYTSQEYPSRYPDSQATVGSSSLPFIAAGFGWPPPQPPTTSNRRSDQASCFTTRPSSASGSLQASDVRRQSDSSEAEGGAAVHFGVRDRRPGTADGGGGCGAGSFGAVQRPSASSPSSSILSQGSGDGGYLQPLCPDMSVPTVRASRLTDASSLLVPERGAASVTGIGSEERHYDNHEAHKANHAWQHHLAGSSERAAEEQTQRLELELLRREKRTWTTKMSEREEEWQRRVQCAQQKSFHAEQRLLMQLCRCQVDCRTLRDDIAKVTTERDELAGRCQTLKEKLETSCRSESHPTTNAEREDFSKNEMNENIKNADSADISGIKRLSPKEDHDVSYPVIRSPTPAGGTDAMSGVSAPHHPDLLGDRPTAERLESELGRVREELARCRSEFVVERDQWLDEKNKVIGYQKQLQLNYVQMLQRNKMLQEEVQQLTLELEKQHVVSYQAVP